MSKVKRSGVCLLLSTTLIVGASGAMASNGPDIELNKSALNTAFDLKIDGVFESASLLSGMIEEQATAEGWSVLASNDHGGDDHGDDDGGDDHGDDDGGDDHGDDDGGDDDGGSTGGGLGGLGGVGDTSPGGAVGGLGGLGGTGGAGGHGDDGGDGGGDHGGGGGEGGGD